MPHSKGFGNRRDVRSTDPVAIGDIVDRLLQEDVFSRGMPIANLLRAWPEIVSLSYNEAGRWLDAQEYYLSRDLGRPTLVVDWADMNDKPYLMEVLGSGILRDMVMDVLLENKAPKDATARAQRRLEELLKSKGYLK